MTNADAFYPRDRIGRFFTLSMLAHAAIIAAALITGALTAPKNWGAEHASSGSVGVNVVTTLNIPRREGPVNPLAHESESTVPTLPEKPHPSAKLLEPNAIPIPNKFEKPKKAPRPPAPTAYKPPVPYKDNQVYSRAPQATTSPLYGMKGAGGIDAGPASVLGSRFGAYVDLMVDRIAQHWNRAGLTANPSQVAVVTFTIARNGEVSNVRIARGSGNYLLDTSAQRAVMDASPLPALPAQFDRNEVTVTLNFQVPR